MAPSAIYHGPLAPNTINKSDLLKVQNAPFVYRNDTTQKPVADDYMYSFKYNFPLPTYGDGTDVLDFDADEESQSCDVAERFLKEFEQIIQSRDAKAFADLFLQGGEFGTYGTLS